MLFVTLLFLGFAWWHGPHTLFAVHDGPGAFYRLMPHGLMVAVVGTAFVFALVALAMAWRRCRHDLPPIDLRAAEWWRALRDAASLRYLDGGGLGCSPDEDRAADRRRGFHHLAFYGFLLCFASTVVATFHHYVLGRPAPYAWHDLPVVLGTIGGVGLVIGPAGLLATRRRDGDAPRARMDTAFSAMLLLTGATGLALLALRATPAMATLLAIHLGVALGFFVTLPYGKFVHGLYRVAALLRYAAERRAGVTASRSASWR